MFSDERAGIVVADRGKPGGSKFRHIIEEHDRLRRVRDAQDKILSEYRFGVKAEHEVQTDPLVMRSMIPNGTKWVATKAGYQKMPCRL